MLIDKNNVSSSQQSNMGLTPQLIKEHSTQLKCSNDECDSVYFIPVMVYRKVSGLLIGKKEDVIVPIPASICAYCGTPLDELNPLE